MFLHWLVGILCAFYFASFVLLLREVLRPGVLWFLRNLNDPDFNPVQEVPLLAPTEFLFSHGKPFVLLPDDSPTDCPSPPPVRRFIGDFWNYCFLDAVGSHPHFTNLHAQFLAILHCELDVSMSV